MKTRTYYALVLLWQIMNVSYADTAQNYLVQALHNDQKHRHQLNQLKQDAVANHALIKQLEASQQQLDEQNQTMLQEVVEQLGHWPGINDVGENPAKIAMILFKRTDSEQQARYLPMIAQEVGNNIPASWYAEMYDHHLMQQDRPQKYGYLMIESNTNNMSLYPVKSIDTVNKNRQQLGLKPLQVMLGEKNWLLRRTSHGSQNHTIEPAEKLMKVAELALTCLDQEYPNSVKHVLNDDQDAKPPSLLYPVFFGCFDWHSSVHGHWLLARAAKLFPNHEKSAEFINRLDAHFTKEGFDAELSYFQQAGRSGFERPYGLAWLLQLYTELHDWQHPQAQQWLQRMEPLKTHVVETFSQWIPKLAYPIRSGEHSQTAFAFGLAYDYAQATGDVVFQSLLDKHIKRLYLNDRNCPIDYEPSGHDFLSPCLAEADLMRRVLIQKEFSAWLKKFLPLIKHGSNWLSVAQVTDRADGKLAHLDGLNLARAWMLEGIAFTLPEKDKRRQILMNQADAHAQAGLSSVTGEHYAGGHWLGSFATYYLTQRGISNELTGRGY
ncbi:MAG: DUF2891 domain-containing protein [Xanthomonadales bacterium]|nr:DUF2891 domain-containing protein [Xanthomonadales bacterium]